MPSIPAPRTTAAPSGRTILLNSVTETEWQTQVLLWAKNRGWLRFHLHDSRKQEWDTDAGVPDLLLCHPVSGRLIFAELKTQRGYVSLKQTTWIQALTRVPCIEVYVWRPGDERAVKALLEPSR